MSGLLWSKHKLRKTCLQAGWFKLVRRDAYGISWTFFLGILAQVDACASRATTAKYKCFHLEEVNLRSPRPLKLTRFRFRASILWNYRSNDC